VTYSNVKTDSKPSFCSIQILYVSFGLFQVLEWAKYNFRWATTHGILPCVIINLTKTKPKCRSVKSKTKYAITASIGTKRQSCRKALLIALVNWSSASVSTSIKVEVFGSLLVWGFQVSPNIMPRRKYISSSYKQLLLSIHKHFGVYHSAVEKIIHNWKTFKTAVYLLSSGRPCKFTPRADTVIRNGKNPRATSPRFCFFMFVWVFFALPGSYPAFNVPWKWEVRPLKRNFFSCNWQQCL